MGNHTTLYRDVRRECMVGGVTDSKPREAPILLLCLNVFITHSTAWAERVPSLSSLWAPELIFCSSPACMFASCPSVPWGLREDYFSGSQQGSWIQTRMPGLVEGSQRIVMTTPYIWEVLLQSAFLAIGSLKSHRAWRYLEQTGFLGRQGGGRRAVNNFEE